MKHIKCALKELLNIDFTKSLDIFTFYFLLLVTANFHMCSRLLIKPKLLPSKVYIAAIEISDFLATVTLTLTR